MYFFVIRSSGPWSHLSFHRMTGTRGLSGSAACRWYIDENIADINAFRKTPPPLEPPSPEFALAGGSTLLPGTGFCLRNFSPTSSSSLSLLTCTVPPFFVPFRLSFFAAEPLVINVVQGLPSLAALRKQRMIWKIKILRPSQILLILLLLMRRQTPVLLLSPLLNLRCYLSLKGILLLPTIWGWEKGKAVACSSQKMCTCS